MTTPASFRSVSATYRFVRDTSTTNGFLSSRSPLADAINVLSDWQNRTLGRTYDLLAQSDNALVACLSFLPPDQQHAADALNALCLQFGIERELIEVPR